MRPIRIMRDFIDTEGVEIALLAVPTAALLAAGRGPLIATIALLLTSFIPQLKKGESYARASHSEGYHGPSER